MKTHKHLYPRICDFENLYCAYRQARRGKRDKTQVFNFEFNAEAELLRLQTELIQQTYAPGSYTNFRLADRKRRLTPALQRTQCGASVSAAPFRDRVAHHALCNLTAPIFEHKFIDDSYANRVGKGTHRALDRAQHFARRYRYVLQGDIVQFFPSIDHAVLRQMLTRPIADEQTLWLIDQILASGASVHRDAYVMQWFPGDNLFALHRARGLPIGNLTSQFWANVYLNALDQFIKRELKCAAYLRYVDDFLLFGNDKPALWEWKERLAEFLQTLRLVMHPRKSTVHRAVEGVPFLGWQVFPTHRRLKCDNVRDFIRRFRSQVNAYARGELSLDDLTTRTRAWIAHAEHGDTYHLRSRIFSSIPIPSS